MQLQVHIIWNDINFLGNILIQLSISSQPARCFKYKYILILSRYVMFQLTNLQITDTLLYIKHILRVKTEKIIYHKIRAKKVHYFLFCKKKAMHKYIVKRFSLIHIIYLLLVVTHNTYQKILVATRYKCSTLTMHFKVLTHFKWLVNDYIIFV